jgi:SM-20-related protein
MQAFLSTIDDLSAYMNRTCFTGISSREFMFAAYPPGARYARHLDDFQNKNARKFSVITYLNRGWDGGGNGNGDGGGNGNGDGDGDGNGNGNGNGDGGELILYGASGVESVAPTFGTTVIFPSAELEHEVLPARRERYSVSGWLR